MTLGVVIPVYHGGDVVARSLGSLLRQVSAGAVTVVVAVNDGLDDSVRACGVAAEPLRAAGMQVRLIETPAGRAAAFDAAERLLPPGPRLYLDQDAVLSPTALARLAAALAPTTGVHFAAPQMRWSRGRGSWLVHWYYDAWRNLPYVARSPVTAGAYAVSWDGRGRWGGFPQLHSDDKFVRLHFRPDERKVVTDCTYEVLLPASLSELVAARRRYSAGNRELARQRVSVAHVPDLARWEGAARQTLWPPARWPGTAVMVTVHAFAAASSRMARLP